MFVLGQRALIVGLAVCLAGCSGTFRTIGRARAAQREVAAIARDVPVAGTNAAPFRVDLKGRRFVDYVEFAMTNRPSVETARLAVSNAVLAIRSVQADRFPQLDVSGGYAQATANRTSHFSWHQPQGQFAGDVSVDLLLYDFGRVDAAVRQARENLVAAQRDLADARFTVFNDVAQSYFTLLRNDALLEVALTNEITYAEHLKQSELLYAAGEAKKLDVLKARVDLSNARLAAINASNDVLTAGAEFLRALGLQADRADRADVLPVATDSLEASRTELPVTRYGAREGLLLAQTNAPSLKVLRAKLRAASAEVSYRIADLMPKLTLTSAVSFADPAWNWSWAFNALQSVFDGYRKRTAVDTAVVELEAARVAVEEAEQKLSCDLSVATSSRDNARQALATARIQVEQARENLATVIEQYAVGDASRVDFTDAANEYATALGTRVRAFYAGEQAEAELIRLTGCIPPSAKAAEGKPASATWPVVQLDGLLRPACSCSPCTHREVNDAQMD
ncbi:MAG: TolC family protein [Kiritimatiellia bacterium]